MHLTTGNDVGTGSACCNSTPLHHFHSDNHNFHQYRCPQRLMVLLPSANKITHHHHTVGHLNSSLWNKTPYTSPICSIFLFAGTQPQQWTACNHTQPSIHIHTVQSVDNVPLFHISKILFCNLISKFEHRMRAKAPVIHWNLAIQFCREVKRYSKRCIVSTNVLTAVWKFSFSSILPF
jgi:hypothetical protein